MELGGEVGHGIFGRSSVVEVDLHGVEVPNGPQSVQVHRAELANEVIQLLDQYAVLGGGYFQEG